MEKEIEEQKTHNDSAVEEPTTDEIVIETPEEEEKEDLEELRKRASLSSQNFERVKKLEEKIKEMEAKSSSDVLLDEPDVVEKMASELSELKAKEAKRDVLEAHPELKEAWGDFEQFYADPDNAGMKITTAAKAFLVEKGISSDSPRKGVEKPTGGTRKPVQSGTTLEDVENIRKNNSSKYRDMLKKGQIKFKN